MFDDALSDRQLLRVALTIDDPRQSVQYIYTAFQDVCWGHIAQAEQILIQHGKFTDKLDCALEPMNFNVEYGVNQMKDRIDHTHFFGYRYDDGGAN